MNGLLTGVGMSRRGDGEQVIQWLVLKRSLNQGLSFPHPLSFPNLSSKSIRNAFVLSLDLGKGQNNI
jgi:hypothetical protein